jgi:glycosyltransferase involved in cell wall biosynthesis
MAATGVRVIVAVPYWAMNGVNVFSANLVRGLCASGIAAQVLLTEQNTRLVSISEPLMPLPIDIPVDQLPVSEGASWGVHWAAMIRYLEERAPCIYVPNADWRHSVVSPKLSQQVGIVGVVHSDDPLHYDHVARLGRYWNAVVTTSKAIAERVVVRHPDLSPRSVTIPIGVPVIEHLPERRLDATAPLRIIYHGGLTQHQKRVLDLPRIAAALVERGVPVELTIAGDGPDRERLLAASQPLAERGATRFLGVVPHAQIPDLLAQHDVYVLTSEFEGMPNALNEAMGHGCVPVVTDVRSGIPELVQDGVNGFRVPVGDIQAFAGRLAWLQRNPVQRGAMAEQAHRTVMEGGYRLQDMVERYLALFQHVMRDARHGVFRRPRGKLLPPPQQVAGVSILPGDYASDVCEAELFFLSRKSPLLAPLPAMCQLGRRGLRRIRSLFMGG